MVRCEMCGKRVETPEATLCGSCAYTRKKQEKEAAEKDTTVGAAPPTPADTPDLDGSQPDVWRYIEDTERGLDANPDDYR